ncbi:MAG: cytochrome c [Bacteroidota bacterium]
MKTNSLIFLTIFLSSSLFFSFTTFQKKPWTVPDKYDKMTNPVKSDAESLKDAKALWVKHCQSCHGKTGQGDGTKAAQLDTEVGDLSSADAQNQSDGSLFYKSLEGRDDMPSFKKKIPDEDELWALVNFMRTLKAK